MYGIKDKATNKILETRSTAAYTDLLDNLEAVEVKGLCCGDSIIKGIHSRPTPEEIVVPQVVKDFMAIDADSISTLNVAGVVKKLVKYLQR